jgi:hypothetical protein
MNLSLCEPQMIDLSAGKTSVYTGGSSRFEKLHRSCLLHES